MSGRMSKLSKTDSTGPLSEVEVSRCAELVHRAIVHEQGWRLVQAVGRHIHGRGTKVHVQDLLDKVQQGMSDASKRRLDTDSEWEALTEQCGTEPRDEDPSLDFAEGYKSPVQKPCASGAPMASYAPAGGQVVIPLPPGVHNVNEWGRTIIKMKKYKSCSPRARRRATSPMMSSSTVRPTAQRQPATFSGSDPITRLPMKTLRSARRPKRLILLCT